MPALNFKKEFVPSVESGKKRQTIRALRKRRFWIGDELIFYTAMRTKQCRYLGVSLCSEVGDISISAARVVKVNGHTLSLPQMNNLAVDDGFTHFKPMGDFFESVHGLPFQGQIIRWKKIIKPKL